MNPEEKISFLKDYLSGLGNVLVAYSGGVDSTFLLAVSREVLGPKVTAVTAVSGTYPREDLEWALKVAESLNVNVKVIQTEELSNPNFVNNPPERCYYCKKELYTKLKSLALTLGITHILDGTNGDDTNDFRPGMKAAREMGVLSPLKEFGFTKEEIRSLSKDLGLPTWDKPAMPCLSSRIPYGQEINLTKIEQVYKGEAFLRKQGFKEVRVRHHGQVARIEIEPVFFNLIISSPLKEEILTHFKKIGFNYVAIDLAGFRSGSMNEVLSKEITGDG